MAERYASGTIAPDAVTIRTAMNQHLGHPVRGIGKCIGAAGHPAIPQSCHAAHSALWLPVPGLRPRWSNRPSHELSFNMATPGKAIGQALAGRRQL